MIGNHLVEYQFSFKNLNWCHAKIMVVVIPMELLLKAFINYHFYKPYVELKYLSEPVDTGDKITCHMTNTMHCGADEELYFDSQS